MTLAVAKSCGPGRPKDLEKRAAILAAAKRLFPMAGFEGTSMDAIAAEAGVSKLTVYSHFTDKETLFVAAIRARCQDQVPDFLFDVDTSGPVRGQLEAIARAFLGLVTSPEAISLHRLLTASGSALPNVTAPRVTTDDGVEDVTGFKVESFRGDHAGWPPPSQPADGDTRVAPDALWGRLLDR